MIEVFHSNIFHVYSIWKPGVYELLYEKWKPASDRWEDLTEPTGDNYE